MDINPSYVTIGKIFEQNYLFEIPRYQRYYAWEEEQVADYIRDISMLVDHEEKADHFFGGIVCVEKQVPGSSRQQRELVDGQQRITTTILLVMAIYQKYKEILQEVSEEDLKKLISSRIEKIESKYIQYKDEINRKEVVVNHLSVSKADEECYEAIIKGKIIPEKRESHKKMNRAYKRLSEYVATQVNSCDEASTKIDVLGKIIEVIDKKCTIIFIDTKTKKDAYSLFQVLNDRGTGLTVGDLLKSKTLEIIAEDASCNDEEMILKRWDEMLANESKSVDRFLRYYYMSMTGTRAGTNSLFDDYLDKIFQINEAAIEYSDDDRKRVLETIETLHEASTKFYSIESGEWPYEEKQPVTLWNRSRLKNLTRYLDYEITLALLMAATELDHKSFSEIVQILEKFMFRYKGICNNKHQKLSEIFMKEALKIREDPKGYRISRLTNQLRPLLVEDASDELFKEKLKSLRYIKKGANKIIKYLFATINEYHEWYDSGAIGKPKPVTGKVINFEDVSIEHIISQNPQDTESVECDVNELKNLTILTLSENGDKVKNKPYSEKKPIYIKSEYSINERFQKYDKWTQDEMNDWLDYITTLSCKVFTI